jgi:hypothetical protein
MISESRVSDGSIPIPKLLIDKVDISGFMKELKGFYSQFADCFSREEPRENLYPSNGRAVLLLSYLSSQ